MKKLPKYTKFITESMFFSQNVNFIWVPVDKDFNCLIPNLSASDTPFPSEMNIGTNIAGFVLVPSHLDTRAIINSPWMKDHSDTPDITGYYEVTDDPRKDGFILMNFDPTNGPGGMSIASGAITMGGNFKTPKKTATIPGFQQHYGLYFKSGSAWVLEKLMMSDEYEKMKMSDITPGRKVANGFSNNNTIGREYFDLDEVKQSLKELFGACSSSFGFVLSGGTKEKFENKTEDLLLDLFKTKAGYFMGLNIDKEIGDRVIARAQETEGEDIVETIENLSDLKESGFFDD